MKNIEELKDLILTNEQYAQSPFAMSADVPWYAFELSHGNKSIFYFGSHHTVNPRDPMFAEIQQKFETSHPQIVYVEGRQYINTRKDMTRKEMKEETLEDAKLQGESSFALKLAVDAGIDFESPEPDFSEELLYVASKGFSKKDIFTFYHYRDIDQYQRQHEENRSKEECIEYLEPYFRSFGRCGGWKASELNELEREIIDDLDVEDIKKYNEQVDPIPREGKNQTILNDISRASSNFRDRHIIERIAEGLKQYNRLFVVYGSGHAIKHEPPLRALMNQ